MTTKNIDLQNLLNEGTIEEGAVGFLVENTHTTKGWTRYDLRDTAPKTNRSLKIQVHGWCGSYNDISTYGAGIARVVKVFRNGRVRIEVLTESAPDVDFRILKQEFAPVIEKFLEETGYDDLTWEVR